MKRGLILVAFALSALVCYVVGLEKTMFVLIGAGCAFELAFWFKLIQFSKK